MGGQRGCDTCSPFNPCLGASRITGPAGCPPLSLQPSGALLPPFSPALSVEGGASAAFVGWLQPTHISGNHPSLNGSPFEPSE